MPRACVLVNPRMSHQGSWAEAFAAGLRRHGWEARLSHDYFRADLLAMWGCRKSHIAEQAKNDGAEVVICERGYMGGRKTYCSVSFGGSLNGRAEFRGPFDDPSRFERLFAHLMRPWQPAEGGYALLMGQVDGDMSTRGVDLKRWYETARGTLEALRWPVRFRPHPLNASGGAPGRYREAQQAPAEDLAADLDGAGLVVTWNSNAGVDAVLAGKPVIAVDEGSMARPVAGHTLRDVVMPDRLPWARALAWKQWRKDEMASGECWEAVNAGRG